MRLRALVFDAYGMLLDVHPVIERCAQIWPSKRNVLSQVWRAKRLEYTWQRSLVRRQEDFGSLRSACPALDPALLGRAA